MENWTLLIKVKNQIRANVIIASLHQANIDTAVINKKDSAYVFLGEQEIYVRPEDVRNANTILQSIRDLEEE